MSEQAEFPSNEALLPQMAGDATLSYVSLSVAASQQASLAPATVAGEVSLAEPQESGAATEVAGAGETYVLRRKIGVGGMGEVWEAVQVSLGRTVAIKRLKRGGGQDGDSASRVVDFRREAVIAGRLEHPNIVPVHDLGAAPDGDALLAMKLVEGRCWKDLLKDDAGLAPADFLARHVPILISTAQAAAFAHSRGIVHRDLKPAQVMVGDFGEVLLADWGLALAFREIPEQRGQVDFAKVTLPTLETASAPSGTPALMAPEQTEPSAVNIGPWTDVYQLGGILYFLLTLSFPHTAQTAAGAFAQAARGKVDPPEVRAPGRDIPPELSELAMRCLNPNRFERDVTAGDFVRLLQDFLTGTSRRRESQAIAATLRRTLGDPATDTYEKLTDAWTELSRAGELWSENPELPELRERVLERHVALAIVARDLRLARIQAERLPFGDRREALLTKVAAGERAVAKDARIRRVAVAASFALLIAVIAVVAIFSMNLYDEQQRTLAEQRRVVEERQRAMAERDKARRASDRANELVRFMIKDLRGEVKALTAVAPHLRLDMLDDIAAAALENYELQLEETTDPKGLSRLQQAIDEVRILADDQRNTSVSIHAARLMRRCATKQLQLSGSRTAKLDYGLSVASEAMQLTNMRRMDEAVLLYEELFAFYDTFMPEEKSLPWQDIFNIILIHAEYIGTLSALKRFDETEPLLAQAEGYIELLLKGEPDNAEFLEQRARFTSLRAACLPDWDIDGKLALYGAADERYAAIAAMPGPKTRTLGGMWAANGEQIGRFLLAKGRSEEAIGWFERKVRQSEEELERDPTMISFERELLASLGFLAEAYLNLGRPEEALPRAERALVMMRVLAMRDAKNRGLQRDLAYCLMRTSRAFADLDRWEDSYAAAEEAVAIAEAALAELGEGDTGGPQVSFERLDWQALHLTFAGYLANAHLGIGNTQEAIDLLEPLLAARSGLLLLDNEFGLVAQNNFPELYLLISEAHMRQEEDEAAFGALERALRFGARVVPLLEAENKLAPLRERQPERFEALLRELE